MNSAYNFNLYIKGKFSSSVECTLYIGLTVFIKGKKVIACKIICETNNNFKIWKRSEGVIVLLSVFAP